MRTLRLLIEYDGTSYVGWQRQINGVSIQATIEDVLSEILQEKINIIGAGRTDAGVHARGQVAHFLTGSLLSENKIKTALNGLLPQDIVIHSVNEEEENFHARYSAKSREYSYTISIEPMSIGRQYSWYSKYDLNLTLLQELAALTIGEHDFKGFSKVGSDVNHYRCIVFVSDWVKNGMILTYKIAANRFMRGMVRSLVGAMVDVGRGYIPLSVFVDRLNNKEIGEYKSLAPAKGLVLEKVEY